MEIYIEEERNKDAYKYRAQIKMPPSLQFSRTQQKQFLLCRNSTSTRAESHQTIFMIIFI